MEEKACQETPDKDLRDRIMNPTIPKSEAEHWAKNEIDRLTAENKGLNEYSESRDESIKVYREEIKQLTEELRIADLTVKTWVENYDTLGEEIAGLTQERDDHKTAHSFVLEANCDLAQENAGLKLALEGMTKQSNEMAEKWKKAEERLKEIREVVMWPTDDMVPPLRHYGYLEAIKRVQKVLKKASKEG